MLSGKIITAMAIRQLDKASNTMRSSLERLSSGLRINKASDDAAGLAIASTLNARSRIYTQAIRNANDGISALNIAEGTTSQLSDIVIRLKELATQSANGSFSTTQRIALDKENEQLTAEYNRLVDSTSFNGRSLLNGTLGTLNIQIGLGSQEQIGFRVGQGLSSQVGNGFNTATNVASGYSSHNGDINGDGKLDLVYRSGNNLVVQRGNGDGTYQAAQNLSSWNGVTRPNGDVLAVGDVNGDGYADAVYSTIDNNDPANGELKVSFGSSSGTFSTTTTLQGSTDALQELSSAAIGDVDGDGRVDIVTDSRIFKRIGSASFQSSIFGTSPGSSALVLNDLNGDGIKDLISSNNNQVTVQIGTGSAFGSRQVIANTGSIYQNIAVGDFNFDGKVDLAIAGTSTGKIGIFSGKGDGTFGTVTEYNSGGVDESIATGDFNGDGYTDLIVGGSSANSFSLLYSKIGGGFSAPSIFSLSASTPSISTGDFNGDGVTDVLSTAGGTSLLQSLATTESSTHLARSNLLTAASSRATLDFLDTIQAKISTELGNLGSAQSRLDISLKNLGSLRENIDAARSRIIDVDVAAESAELVRTQILQQTASAVVAQANTSSRLVLGLIQNI